MVVLLVVITFAIFMLVDGLLNRKRALVVPLVAAQKAEGAAAAEADRVLGGFRVPVHLKYHAGHTWIQRERKNVHRVGADEFAAIMAGPVDAIELPKAGQPPKAGQQ